METRTYYQIEFPSDSIDSRWRWNPMSKLTFNEAVAITENGIRADDELDPEMSTHFAESRVVKVTETREEVWRPNGIPKSG